MLQILSAATDVISIGAIIPFIAVLSAPDTYLDHASFQSIINYLGIETGTDLVLAMSVAFGAAFTTANAFRLFVISVQIRLAAAIGNELSVALFRRLLHQDFEFFAQSNSGDLLNKITLDMNAAIAVFPLGLMVLTQGLAISAIVAAAVAYEPVLAAIMGAILGLSYALVNHTNRRQMLRGGQIRSDQNQALIRVTQEGLGGIRDVVLARAQDFFIARYSRADYLFRRVAANMQLLRTFPRYLMETIGVLVLTGSVTYLVSTDGNLHTILPTIGGLAMAANRLLPALQQVYNSIASLQGVQVPLQRTLATLELPLDPAYTGTPKPLPKPRKCIALEGVWFGYGGRKTEQVDDQNWILQNLSIEIPVNKTVALVGKSGSGKSTIADLISGLLIPQKGCLTIDGRPLKTEDLTAWRQMVASVPQMIFLSDSSIAENIAFATHHREINTDKISEAGNRSSLDAVVSEFPDGYDQEIGEHGVRLSGGQRQRVGIARALYRSSRLIIFDEATSALDNRTESDIIRAIDKIKKEATVLMIAHRLSTVRNADLIYEIDEGTVVASGSFEELLEKSPSFRLMVEAGENDRRSLLQSAEY